MGAHRFGLVHGQDPIVRTRVDPREKFLHLLSARLLPLSLRNVPDQHHELLRASVGGSLYDLHKTTYVTMDTQNIPARNAHIFVLLGCCISYHHSMTNTSRVLIPTELTVAHTF
jgi:hypothetical protein